MKFIFRLLACIVLPVSAFVMSGCQEKDTLGDTGFWGVSAPQTVMNSGEMVTISFETSDAWTIDPVTSDGEDWITVRATDNSESAGKGTVRMSIAQNNGAARSVDVFITVSGFERSLLCTISQGEGSGEMNSAINEAMHSRLMEDYLWKDDYAALSNEGKIEMDAAWSDFLYTNLTKLGETNIEDGGRYREYSTLAGERYIYSYIEEVSSTRSQPQTRAASAYGLGLGPTMANPLYDGMSDVGLVIGYVYQGSPAYKAGLRRGDIIYSINGNKLNLSNYSSYQQELYYAPQGPYAIEYYRYEPLGGKLDLVARTLDQPLAMGTFPMSPVLLCTIFQGDTEYNGQTYKSNIGYFVFFT